MEDDYRPCRTARAYLVASPVFQFVGRVGPQVRTRHEARGTVVRLKLVNHQDEADQRLAFGVPPDIRVQRLCRGARFQSSRQHRAELEWLAHNPETGCQQRRVDVQPIELRPAINEIMNPCRN
jgi:hypothetical protein